MNATAVLFVAGLLAGPWPLAADVDVVRARDRQDSRSPRAAELPGPRRDVLRRVCASPFGAGDFARVEVYRNKAGAVAVLALRPDIQQFTHAPHTYYRPDGAELLVVADRPVVKGDPESDALVSKLAALLRDLRGGGSQFCSEYR